MKKNLSPKTIDAIFKALSNSLPSPETALKYSNHFELLIAVILSAQATDISVNKVSPELFKIAPTPAKILELGEQGLQRHIKSIGLYKTKAANIIKTCQLLITNHNAIIPSTRLELEKLHGVGRKTAGVVLNVAFGKAEIPVDTHVFRLSHRLGLAKAKTPVATEIELQAVVPNWIKNRAHHLLILHGRHVCKARKPICRECVVRKYCTYENKSAS
jgi:endonuclease III